MLPDTVLVELSDPQLNQEALDAQLALKEANNFHQGRARVVISVGKATR